ncbi:hypothetical protein L6164_019446 [Bauhinia variegata]|uniref:Uncharacterized protein n=1 Tax=Bauhinia variegata TaxID=167791 RepID=A0ACB9MS10_BAUVA|nr:hypothetical protein L6164_019446 [Bauhinia variegata]
MAYSRASWFGRSNMAKGTLPVKSRVCSCSNSCAAIGHKATNAGNTETEDGPLEQTTGTVDLSTAKGVNPSEDDALERQVSVGPLFQAEVPEWTGVVCDSHSKWLCTQVWPWKHSHQNLDAQTMFIGKGSEEKCSCEFQGSVH